MKKYRGIIVSFFIMFITIGRIYYVNYIYPQVRYQDIKIGESARWNNVQFCINNAYVFNSAEATKKYGEDCMNEMEDIDFKLIEVSAEVLNNNNSSETVYLYDLYFENKVYANGIAAEVQVLTDTNELDIDLEPFESREVTLCYIVYENQFNEKEWNKFGLEGFYISGEHYPVKNRWRLA